MDNSYDSKNNQQRLDRSVALQKKALEQQQVSLQGSSDNPAVTLGKIIHIGNDKESFGRYRITEVKHSGNTTGNYANHFVAIPIDIDVYPNTDIEVFSSSHPQLAKIMDTNDPEGLSRVQIRYPFDEKKKVNSPWIRVATPYAGTNYGIHAIPEIGSSVIIGYHAGNIEQPYVMSAMYTGVQKNTNWQSEENNYKGWHTKAGNKIELNDTKDGETITITDKNSNTFLIDTASNTIRIAATENLELTAKNILVTAEESINIESKGTIATTAENDIKTLAKGKITSESDGETTIKSKESLAIEAKGDTTMKGKNTTIEGKTETKLKGQKTQISGNTTEVKGVAFKINLT